MIAIYAGAYGIVEEKVSRRLEPLLATPVRTWNLLPGKALAGFIPAIVITWICAALALVGIHILGWGYLIPHYIGSVWVANLFLISPATILIMGLILCVIDPLALRIAVRLF